MTITMATVDGILREEAPSLFVDTVARNTEFLPFFTEETDIRDVTGPSWQVKTAGHDGIVNYAPGDALAASDEFDHAQASLTWGYFQGTVRIHDSELVKLARGGPQLIQNYVIQQLDDAMLAMVAKMNAQALGGATTNGFVGITEMVASGNTYAGLDRTTVTAWQSVATAVGGAITAAILDTAHISLVQTRKGNYNAIFTTQAIADSISALSSGNGVPALRNNTSADPAAMVAKIGFGGLDPLIPSVYYRNRPIFAIPGYTSGRLDMVDTRGLHIEFLEKANLQMMGKVNLDTVWSLNSIAQVYMDNPPKQSHALTGIT